MHKEGSLLEAVGGVISFKSLMAVHNLHFDQVLEFVERHISDVFFEIGIFHDVYCVDVATTDLELPTYLLAYSDFVSVVSRPNTSVPYVPPVNIRFLRVSMLCVRQMLVALRSGKDFLISQQIFDCGIGLNAGGEYKLVRPESNPDYKLAGFDYSVQWCFGIYVQSVPPIIIFPGDRYSSPVCVNIDPGRFWVSDTDAKNIELSLGVAVVDNLHVETGLVSSLPVAEANGAAIEIVRGISSFGESDKLLCMNDLIGILSFSRSKINNLRKPGNERHDPTFPKPVDTGSTAVRWRESDINEWISSRKLKA